MSITADRPVNGVSDDGNGEAEQRDCAAGVGDVGEDQSVDIILGVIRFVIWVHILVMIANNDIPVERNIKTHITGTCM